MSNPWACGGLLDLALAFCCFELQATWTNLEYCQNDNPMYVHSISLFHRNAQVS